MYAQPRHGRSITIPRSKALCRIAFDHNRGVQASNRTPLTISQGKTMPSTHRSQVHNKSRQSKAIHHTAFDQLEKNMQNSQDKISNELKHMPTIWQILGGFATLTSLAVATLAYIDTNFNSGQNSQRIILNATSISIENQKVNQDQNKRINQILKTLETPDK